MTARSIVLFLLLLPAASADPRLVANEVMQALAAETSGVSAKRNLDQITLYHRTRASSQFRKAAEHILDKLHAYGLGNATIREYPADGSTMFGTQKSRPAWDVEHAELWELDANQNRSRRLAHWESMPLSVAQDSLSGQVQTTLIDVGVGTAASDYEGRDIAGRLVLTSSQPGAIADLAVGEHGAAGIVSYAPNQRSAWWKEDDRLVRWGHLSSFPKQDSKTFAFMISLGEARALQSRMAAGESIALEASISATQSPGSYTLVDAAIEGADPAVGAEEIVLTCHLDHPRPGANDNTSGCVAILEAARALNHLIIEGLITKPRRTIRFLWPAEIEGTLIYLNAHPQQAARIRANIHMDMVGGNANTKAVYRISGGPYSLPSFIGDVGHAFGNYFNDQTLRHTSGQPSDYALTSPEGGKEPLLAVMEGLSMGSDHDMFREGSWKIPGLYFHDWPDRYIHTNFDTAANIDPTKLKRSAFLGALNAWYLASFDQDDLQSAFRVLRQSALQRASELVARRTQWDSDQLDHVVAVHWQRERLIAASLGAFAEVGSAHISDHDRFLDNLAATVDMTARTAPASGIVYRRNPELKGPMHAFGYSYLTDHLDADRLATLTLDRQVAYETLNLVNGDRSVSEIHVWLLAAFGAVDREAVENYLRALAEIGVIRAS